LKIFFIVNSSARGIRAKTFLPLLQKKIKEHRFSAEIISTGDPAEAREAALGLRHREDAVLAACGGDGTVHAVLQNLVHSPAALGVLPRGTANDLAGAWKIPGDLDRALEILIRGKPAQVDVISAARSGAYIAGAGGVGFDSAVLERIASWKKERRGFSRFVPAVVREFSHYRFPTVSITGASGEYRGPVWQVVFTKTSRYALLLKIGEPPSLDDGLMGVCVLPAVSRSQILRRSAFFPFAGLKTLPGAHYFKASRLKIGSSSLLRYHGDGELIGEVPEEFTVVRRALRVMMPAP
jgi:diacylglycerol kinase (ATP)